MNYRIAVIGTRPDLDMRVFAPLDGKPQHECQSGVRTIYADGRFTEAKIYQRLELAIGEKITGPALLEQPDSTIFIDPGLVGQIDEYGNVIINDEVS